MISDHKNGGLRMIDTESFNKALKSTLVKKYLDSDNHGISGNYSFILKYLGGDVIFKGNLSKNDLAKFIHISDAFISEILKIWSEISYNGNITSTEHLLSLPLWQNSLAKIGNKAVYHKSWSSKGIQNVRHLMKDAHNFPSFTELKERFDINTNFLVYHPLVSCIKLLRKAIENQNEISALNLLPKIERFPSSRQTSWLFTKRDRGSQLGTTEKQIRLWQVRGGLKPGTSGI